MPDRQHSNSLTPVIAISVVIVAMMATLSRGSATASGEDVTPDQKRLEAWWADLENGDIEASRALLELDNRANEAVPFLKDKMKPLTISSDHVKALLLKLNNADEHVWKPAFEELMYFDPRLAIELPDLMEHVTDSPARQRMVEVLSEREAGSLKGKEITLAGKGAGDLNFLAQLRRRGPGRH